MKKEHLNHRVEQDSHEFTMEDLMVEYDELDRELDKLD